MTAAEIALERILKATATVEPDFSLETLYLTLQAVTAIAEEGLGRRCRPEMDSVAWSLPQALSCEALPSSHPNQTSNRWRLNLPRVTADILPAC